MIYCALNWLSKTHNFRCTIISGAREQESYNAGRPSFSVLLFLELHCSSIFMKCNPNNCLYNIYYELYLKIWVYLTHLRALNYCKLFFVIFYFYNKIWCTNLIKPIQWIVRKQCIVDTTVATLAPHCRQALFLTYAEMFIVLIIHSNKFEVFIYTRTVLESNGHYESVRCNKEYRS